VTFLVGTDCQWKRRRIHLSLVMEDSSGIGIQGELVPSFHTGRRSQKEGKFAHPVPSLRKTQGKGVKVLEEAIGKIYKIKKIIPCRYRPFDERRGTRRVSGKVSIRGRKEVRGGEKGGGRTVTL